MTSSHSPPFNLSDPETFAQVLKQVLLGVSSASADNFFESLILHLTEALGVKYGFISELKSEKLIQVIVGCVNGKKSESCLYKIDKTPCQKVIEEGEFVCAENLKYEFPEDIWLQKHNLESYIGKAIYDQKGQVIGLLCIMSIQTLPNLDLIAEILDIFAINVTRELTRIKAEKKLDNLNKNLENLVKSRTIQLRKTNDNLREEIERRKKIEWELIRQEQQFRELVNNLKNGIIIVDKEGKIKFANPAALSIFEQSLESLLNYDFGIPIISDKSVELEIIKYNNNPAVVEMYVSLTEWEKESVYLVSFREITERKKAEMALIKAKEEADLANQFKTDFLSNVSHEMRTPMNAIFGFSELLKLKLKFHEPRLYQYVETIYSSSQALLYLINDLLDINQVEAGKIELNYNDFSLRILIKEIVNLFSYQISKKRIELLIDIAENVPKLIKFESLRLRQIIVNFVINAIKFTKKGYIKIIIDAEDFYNNYCTLKITVEDTGIGIKDENKQRIFEAFTQSKGQDNRCYGGTGLGLFVTQKITDLLGGTISLESQWQEGSRFTVTFPDVEIINSLENIEENTPKKTLDDLDRMTILVIDNVAENCDLIEGYFVGTKHNLFITDKQPKIIDILDNYCVDIILINLHCQNINHNLGLFNNLKLEKRLRNTALISMSPLPTNMTKINENIFQEILENPLNYFQLVEVLSHVLSKKEGQKNNLMLPLTPLDYQAIHNHSDLLEKLEKIEATSWRLMCSRMIFPELQKFSQNLQYLGETHNCQILIDYSEILANNLHSFEIEKLSHTLGKFPQIRVNLLHTANCFKQERNSKP